MQLTVLDSHRAPSNPSSGDELLAIGRDLANAVAGEVRFDAHNRMLYATDASLYQVEPLGVVIPADTDDAVAAARFCASRGLPILPRGGGTSLAGQCTNRAIVIDLSPNCRRMLSVDPDKQTVEVEPGITIDDLNDELTRVGGAVGKLFFAPDPATSRHANIGGCIGNNAAGARSILYGRTSESLLAVNAWIPSLDAVVTLDRGASMRDERIRLLTTAVANVILSRAELIQQRFPKTIRRNAGYALDMILAALDSGGARQWWENGGRTGSGLIPAELLADVNLAHLLCGSEGTLALTLGATLNLNPKPGAKGLAVLSFPTLDESIAAVVPILTTKPSAVELLDDTVIDLARANAEYRHYVDLMPQPARGDLKAVLYVEYFAKDAAEIAARFESLKRTCPGVAAQFHTNAKAMLNAWKLRKAGEPLLHGIPGNRKPITFVEDNAVPVENLVEFVKRFRAVVEKHGTRAAFYAHASVGVLHVRPLIDIHDQHDREIMRSIAVEIADLARSLGGVMSGEHGDGRVRGPLLERFYGPEIMQAFKDIKAIFDPANLLNPGNTVDLDGTNPRPVESMTQNLRVEPMVEQDETTRPNPIHIAKTATFFNYDDQSGFDHAVEMCNGAGVCRKKQGGTMCPSYMATLDERHSTRGRGNALRLAITGQFSKDQLGNHPTWDDLGTIETLNLCLSCKACKTECPSNVDVSRLKAEYTAQRHKQSGTPLAARLFGSVRLLNQLGSLAPRLANWMNSTTLVRAVVGQVLDFHPNRTIPPFARSLGRQWTAPKHGEHTNARTLALFGDCFTMFNEPGIGLAAKRLFETCGYRVALANAGCCARAKISTGLLPDAIDEIDATIERLLPIADDPTIEAILVAEPSCLSAIKDDWLSLKCRTPLEVRKRIAAKCFLPEEFFARNWEKHPTRPNFKTGEKTILHGHCHQKALWGAETSAAALKRAFGETNVEILDSGCCGMAGSFGYTKDRYELSMKIGELTLFPAVRRAAKETTICAPGTSCRHQIHDGTGRTSLHPIELLAANLQDA